MLAQKIGGGAFFRFPPRKMAESVVSHLAAWGGCSVALVAGSDSRQWLPRVAGLVREVISLPAGCVCDHTGAAVGMSFSCWWIEFPTNSTNRGMRLR